MKPAGEEPCPVCIGVVRARFTPGRFMRVACGRCGRLIPMVAVGDGGRPLDEPNDDGGGER